MTPHDDHPRVCAGCGADHLACAHKASYGGRRCCGRCRHAAAESVVEGEICGHCPSSREGCDARRAFGGERCCRRCTHPHRHRPPTPAAHDGGAR